MSEVERSGNPFEKIRHEDHRGEYWTGRELQPVMDYAQWRDFAAVIEKAKTALALVSGQAVADQAFQQFTKVVQVRKLGDQQKHDYRLTRFGAYLTAMAGDDTKEAIALARVYFAVKTRQAEVSETEPLDELELAERYAHVAQRNVVLIKEKRVALARAEKAEGFKRAIEAGNGLMLRAFHKKYFSTTAERIFFEHLYSKSYLIDQRGKGGKDPRTGKLRDGSQHRHPAAKGKRWFYLHTTTDQWGVRHENTRVRPGEPELELRDKLASEGLVSNEVPTGLFELEAA